MENKTQFVLSSDTQPLSELARMIDRLRTIYYQVHIPTNILPYQQQLEMMFKQYQQGMDKKKIMKTAIDYIDQIRNDLEKKGIVIRMDSKEQLENQYLLPQNKEFSELAYLMDNVKKAYENQGYIVQLLDYQDQLQKMEAEFEQGMSKQDVLIEALNQMEKAKNILARNGVPTDYFPKEESLEKYYIGNDKDYIELAKLCADIHRVYRSYNLQSPMLSYDNQLKWIENQTKNGIKKETILRHMIDSIEQAKNDLKSKNISHILPMKEDLLKRYSLKEDSVFVSLAGLIDRIRTFYLSNRLNTDLLPYEASLKMMKDAYQQGMSERNIAAIMLKIVEEARIDLINKGYPLAIPTQEELYHQYNVEEDTKKL